MGRGTTYEPDLVVVTVDTALIEGFAEGTHISVERAEVKNAIQRGTHGETTRTKRSIPDGTITFTVMAGSRANDILQAAFDRHELGLSSVVTVKDVRSAQSLASTPDGVIEMEPTMEYGDEDSAVEWKFVCPNLSMRRGGRF